MKKLSILFESEAAFDKFFRAHLVATDKRDRFSLCAVIVVAREFEIDADDRRVYGIQDVREV